MSALPILPCRSPGCGVALVFVRTPNGKNIPCEADSLRVYHPDRDRGENVVTLDGRAGQMGVRWTEPVEGYLPHWAKCPKAGDWRRA